MPPSRASISNSTKQVHQKAAPAKPAEKGKKAKSLNRRNVDIASESGRNHAVRAPIRL